MLRHEEKFVVGFARFAIAFLVGAVPSAASARPNNAAAFYAGVAEVLWKACGMPWYAHGGGVGGRGNLRVAKTPPPTVGVGGEAGVPIKKTTRHAASLHPLGNGRIGFKPPYSQRETSVKVPYAFKLL